MASSPGLARQDFFQENTYTKTNTYTNSKIVVWENTAWLLLPDLQDKIVQRQNMAPAC